MQFPNPTQCHLWQKEAPERADFGFESVATFVDDEHFKRALVRCRQCGQFYFSEFYEKIDWSGGNDAQYRTYIPLEREKQAAELNELSMLELLECIPRLQWDLPEDAGTPTVRWMTR